MNKTLFALSIAGAVAAGALATKGVRANAAFSMPETDSTVVQTVRNGRARSETVVSRYEDLEKGVLCYVVTQRGTFESNMPGPGGAYSPAISCIRR